ncbi:MAG: transcriptional repressor [Paludibacteraceae bacterium]|nr:transcriptional repressor [Paludibacteraceae bacterium]
MKRIESPTTADDNAKVLSFDSLSVIFNTFLKAHNLRRTPERTAILHRIYNLKGSFTAESIFKYLKTHYRVSLATVYNSLNLMVDCQIIARHQLNNQPARYHKIFNGADNNRIHLVCLRCGHIREYKDPVLLQHIQTRPIAGFSVSYPSLHLFGLCTKCARDERRRIRQSLASL